MAINAFSNLTISVSDGGTVPSIDYLPIKTYVDIGSGNILKVSWNTPTATENAVDSYIMHIQRYDNATTSYKDLINTNIGNVNEFYLRSSAFASLTQVYIPIRVYVEAISKYGTAYNGTSNVIAAAVGKGCGTYIRVTDGYAQPIMKRAIAFSKLGYIVVKDSATNEFIVDDEKVLYAKASSLQDNTTGWSLMQDFYAKDAKNNWKMSDISYEVLTDINGEIITDSTNEAIYVL